MRNRTDQTNSLQAGSLRTRQNVVKVMAASTPTPRGHLAILYQTTWNRQPQSLFTRSTSLKVAKSVMTKLERMDRQQYRPCVQVNLNFQTRRALPYRFPDRNKLRSKICCFSKCFGASPWFFFFDPVPSPEEHTPFLPDTHSVATLSCSCTVDLDRCTCTFSCHLHSRLQSHISRLNEHGIASW